MDIDRSDETPDASLPCPPEFPAPDTRPGRTPPAILPPMEFTPPPSDTPAAPHPAHQPPPPPCPARSPSAIVRILGLIFVPPFMALLGATIVLFILTPGRWTLYPYHNLEAQSAVAVIGFWVGAAGGEIVGLIAWLRFTAPPGPADLPTSSDPRDPPPTS